MKREKDALPVTRIGRIMFGIGSILFIMAGTFTLIHLGFQLDDSAPDAMKPFLTTSELWTVNSILGVIGGVLMNYRRILISGLCGLVAAWGITGTTLLYLTWRESIIQLEIALPLLLGILPAIFLYMGLTKDRSVPTLEIKDEQATN